MVRGFVFGLFLFTAHLPASAQTAREHLPSLNGVDFGSTFSVAQEKLGAGFNADTAPGDDKIKVLLGGPLPFNAASYRFNYTFDADDRLTSVFAQNINSRDFAVCRANWATAMSGLTTQFGKADEVSEDFGTQTQFGNATFKFEDGSQISAMLLGCILQITYERKPN